MQDSGLTLRKGKDLQLVQMSSALSQFGGWTGRLYCNKVTVQEKAATSWIARSPSGCLLSTDYDWVHHKCCFPFPIGCIGRDFLLVCLLEIEDSSYLLFKPEYCRTFRSFCMYWHQLIYGFRGFVGLCLQQFTFGLSKEFARLNYFGLVLVNMERLGGKKKNNQHIYLAKMIR